MLMVRVKIFVVRTSVEAEYLIERFNRSGIKASALDDALLRDDHGQLLFPNRSAGVLCQVTSDQHAQRIDEVFSTLGVDALGLERTFSGSLDHPGRRLAVAYRTLNAVQASLMRNLLEEHGISAVVSGAWLVSEVSAGTPISVLVATEDLEASAEIVALVKGDAAHSASLDEEESSIALASDAKTLAAWPLCPGCQKRRTTMCPYCDTAGSDFPLADANFSAGQEDPQPTLAVICTTCDEPWAPEFFRRCEWCGHNFGHGLKVDYEPVPVLTELEPANGRVLTVLLGLMALFALACAYLALVIRS